MESNPNATLYRVWGKDRVVHGPFDSATLRQWITEARLTGRTWVLLEAANEWKRAADLPELQPFLSPGPQDDPVASGEATRARPRALFEPEALRRIKLFASLELDQLESFARYLEAVQVPQFGNLVRKGQRGDAMYVVLEGELRALTIIEGKESILATMGAGDCFGEISLLDQGPRSADVIANRDSTLLKFSSASFERLIREAPALAMPFILALSRAAVERIRRATKRYEDSIQFIRTSKTADLRR